MIATSISQTSRISAVLFGFPLRAPTVTIPPGATDPGVQKNGDEIEADLDVEWAGAVAKNANINFVTAKSTNAVNGVDIAATYIINVKPTPPSILSESFGLCELELGTAGNAFFQNMWSQAASEGITLSFLRVTAAPLPVILTISTIRMHSPQVRPRSKRHSFDSI